ncbi:MAG: NAD-dependent protein deacylase, partial [Turneriella sp.]|nr:NAD-dependent protein deacylase [Turneriella sp.]
VCGALEEKREDVTPEVRCTHCGGVPLRPDVVWFGEAIPPTTLKTIYDKLSVADAILVVGTSGTVYPAAGFAVEVRRRGGTVIEINTESPHGHYPRDIFLQGKAGTVLPQLVAQLKSHLQMA